MNLYMISTSIRTAYIWVDGYERTAGVAYFRSIGERIYAIQRI